MRVKEFLYLLEQSTGEATCRFMVKSSSGKLPFATQRDHNPKNGLEHGHILNLNNNRV